MSAGVVLKATSGGSVKLQPKDTASDRTLDLPARTGNIAVDGPLFAAYQTAAHNVGTGLTKITYETEEADTANCYDAPNARFTPNVAGWYHITASLQTAQSNTTLSMVISKNGSAHRYGNYAAVNGTFCIVVVSALVYCNGSTDYIEIAGASSVAGNTTPGQSNTYFQGHLVRAA